MAATTQQMQITRKSNKNKRYKQLEIRKKKRNIGITSLPIFQYVTSRFSLKSKSFHSVYSVVVLI